MIKLNESNFYIGGDKSKLCKKWNRYINGFNIQISSRYDDNHSSYWASTYSDDSHDTEPEKWFSSKNCETYEEAVDFVTNNLIMYIESCENQFAEIKKEL